MLDLWYAPPSFTLKKRRTRRMFLELSVSHTMYQWSLCGFIRLIMLRKGWELPRRMLLDEYTFASVFNVDSFELTTVFSIIASTIKSSTALVDKADSGLKMSMYMEDLSGHGHHHENVGLHLKSLYITPHTSESL